MLTCASCCQAGLCRSRRIFLSASEVLIIETEIFLGIGIEVALTKRLSLGLVFLVNKVQNIFKKVCAYY